MAKTVKSSKKVTAKKAAKALPASSKKAAAAPPKKATPKKSAPVKKAIPKIPAPTPAPLPKKPVPVPVRTTKKIIYIDSSLFFPLDSSDGYSDDYQAGRYTSSGDGTLQAPIVLPVGSKINTITVYYKNTTEDEIQVNFVRKHTEHWASTEEFLISYEGLPPAGVAPDFFSSVVINHFGDNKIKEKYLYYIMISMVGKISDTEIRTVRGLRIDYNY